MSQVRNAPLTARSVLLSTLLGTRPPVLPARVLVRAGELFGIAEGTTRTALSRMVASGEIVADDGSYRLAGRLLERQARQEASVTARTRPWRGGTWWFALVEGERRSAAERSELRAAMKASRLAELREGVWLRPDNLQRDALPEARRVVASQCIEAVGTLAGDVDPAELAARLFDTAGWEARARQLRDELADLRPVAPSDLAPGFVLSATVLRHLQADPLLPAELLPPRWPGPALRADYSQWDRAYRSLLRTWWKQPHNA